MKKFFEGIDRTEVTYFAGLGMVFIGILFLYSAPMALLVTGAVMAIESVVTSYLASWIASIPRKK
jgi:hypothetical protein